MDNTLFLGALLAFNVVVILWEFSHSRKLNAIVDGILLALVAITFSGSTQLLIIGTIGSAIISTYILLFNPIKVGK